MSDRELGPRVATFVYLGHDDDYIADKTGLAMNTIARWRTQQWFQDLIVEQAEAALDAMAAKARGNINAALDKGDVTTAKWFLERRDKKFFTPNKKITVEGEVSHTHRALRDLSDEKLAQILAQEEDKPQLEAEYETWLLPETASDEAEDVTDAEFEPA